MAVLAVARYQLVGLWHSQRYLAPMLLFFGLVGMLYQDPLAGPPLPGYAISCFAIALAGAWLTIAVADSEDPVQATVTQVAARGRGRVLAARILTLTGFLLFLAAIAVLVPLFAEVHKPTPLELAAGLLAHLCCAWGGMAVGTWSARPLIVRAGTSWLLTIFLLLPILLIHRLPPLNAAMRILGDHDARSALVPLAEYTAMSFGLLLLSTVALHILVARRD